MNKINDYIMEYLYLEPNIKIYDIMNAFEIPYHICQNIILELEKRKLIDKVKVGSYYIYYLTEKGIEKILKEEYKNKIDDAKILEFAINNNYNLNYFKKYQNYQKWFSEILKKKMTYEEFCILKHYENVDEEVTMSVYLYYMEKEDEDDLDDYFEFKRYCNENKIEPYNKEIIYTKTK